MDFLRLQVNVVFFKTQTIFLLFFFCSWLYNHFIPNNMAIILYGAEETAITLRLLQPVLNTLVTISENIILVLYVPY